jgi:hypothetical protein
MTTIDPAAVVFWLTFTVQADLVKQGAFPRLRAANGVEHRQQSSMHVLTQDEARELIAYTGARREAVSGGLARAYGLQLQRLQQELEDSQQRPELLSSTKPIERSKHNHGEEIVGTKRQLQGLGIGVGDAFPDEPGSPRSRGRTTDTRGNDVVVAIEDKRWGIYRATVTPSQASLRAAKLAKDRLKAEAERIARLKTLPQTRKAYREAVAEAFWKAVAPTQAMMYPSDGYRFSADEKDEFFDLCRNVYWFLKRDAEVIGRAPGDIINSIATLHAQTDDQLQGFLRSVVNLESGVSQ